MKKTYILQRRNDSEIYVIACSTEESCRVLNQLLREIGDYLESDPLFSGNLIGKLEILDLLPLCQESKDIMVLEGGDITMFIKFVKEVEEFFEMNPIGVFRLVSPSQEPLDKLIEFILERGINIVYYRKYVHNRIKEYLEV